MGTVICRGPDHRHQGRCRQDHRHRRDHYRPDHRLRLVDYRRGDLNRGDLDDRGELGQAADDPEDRHSSRASHVGRPSQSRDAAQIRTGTSRVRASRWDRSNNGGRRRRGTASVQTGLPRLQQCQVGSPAWPVSVRR